MTNTNTKQTAEEQKQAAWEAFKIKARAEFAEMLPTLTDHEVKVMMSIMKPTSIGFQALTDECTKRGITL